MDISKYYTLSNPIRIFIILVVVFIFFCIQHSEYCNLFCPTTKNGQSKSLHHIIFLIFSISVLFIILINHEHYLTNSAVALASDIETQTGYIISPNAIKNIMYGNDCDTGIITATNEQTEEVYIIYTKKNTNLELRELDTDKTIFAEKNKLSNNS